MAADRPVSIVYRARCAGHDCHVPYLVSASSERALHDALRDHAEWRQRVNRPGYERGPVTPRIHPECFTETISSLWSRAR